jgi:hypothetical protein
MLLIGPARRVFWLGDVPNDMAHVRCPEVPFEEGCLKTFPVGELDGAPVHRTRRVIHFV